MVVHGDMIYSEPECALNARQVKARRVPERSPGESTSAVDKPGSEKQRLGRPRLTGYVTALRKA